VRRRAAAGVAALVALLAGCSLGGGDDAPITEQELPQVVLLEGDLGPGWSAFDLGRQVQADRVPGAREDPARFGRIDGWKARYRRAGSPDAAGPLVIESRADLFPSEDDAADDLAAYETELAQEAAAAGGDVLDPPELGDGAAAATYVQQGGTAVRYYRIAWRTANATASLTVNGFDGRVTFEQALALARKQQAHLAAAAR
jgi:hypothetical protein